MARKTGCVAAATATAGPLPACMNTVGATEPPIIATRRNIIRS
ncbi:hypothetical protein [Arthrobacter humicola]|nr:hypothetical protein [Arthrobacter humicola]